MVDPPSVLPEDGDPAPASAPDAQDPEDAESPPPDESYLVGATGVEDEVLAELARAEAQMNDPDPAAGDDTRGSAV